MSVTHHRSGRSARNFRCTWSPKTAGSRRPSWGHRRHCSPCNPPKRIRRATLLCDTTNPSSEGSSARRRRTPRLAVRGHELIDICRAGARRRQPGPRDRDLPTRSNRTGTHAKSCWSPPEGNPTWRARGPAETLYWKHVLPGEILRGPLKNHQLHGLDRFGRRSRTNSSRSSVVTSFLCRMSAVDTHRRRQDALIARSFAILTTGWLFSP